MEPEVVIAAAIDTAVRLALLAPVGMALAYIVGESEISLPVRAVLARRGPLGRVVVALMECPVCFGFWSGAGLAVFWPTVFIPVDFVQLGRFWRVVFMGVLVAGLNLIVSRRLGMFVPSHEAPPAEPERPEGTP